MFHDRAIPMTLLAPEKAGVFLRASISSRCDFRCQYCASDMGMENHTPAEVHAPLLSLDGYRKNLERLAEHGVKNVSFTGGEPLLCPFFPELVRGCRGLFDALEITTNGVWLGRYLDCVKENIDILKISLDSVDPRERVQITGSPLAEGTLRVIEDGCAAGIPVIGINFVYMKKNAHQLERIIEFAASMKRRYGTEVYISVLDLYYSPGNRDFWLDQFVDLQTLRDRLREQGYRLTRRIRVGCDSFHYRCNDVLIHMKDSVSCTHRIQRCEDCGHYCQEGVYSLKHSASGWLSVCPNNCREDGTLLSESLSDGDAHRIINHYIEAMNTAKRCEGTGTEFMRRNHLERSPCMNIC